MLSFFNKFFKKKDELIGIWTSYNDGSGLINVFGWSLHLLEGGKGIRYCWDFDKEDEFEFSWIRISKNQIKFRLENEEWEFITYEIVKHNGAYNSREYKLTEINKQSFWNSSESLYKKR